MLLIVYRAIVLIQFGIKYTDQDQAVLWEGVKDFANGEFHEPRYYGQAYNTMLESLLAVIPYKLGVPVYIALPLVTTLLALVPFVVFSGISFFKNGNDKGILILLLALLLPLNYDLITTLPRGFITGIALSSLAMLFYENPKKWKFPLFSFFLVLGFICNPNSIILSLPVFGLYFINNRKNVWYYVGTILGLTAGYFIYFQMNLFYLHSPEYNLHNPVSEFGTSYFLMGLEKINLFFGDFSPVLWDQGWFTLLVLVSFPAVLFIKKQKTAGLIFFATIIMIGLTLFNSRLYNAADTVFYSYSRMFLAVPILFALAIYVVKTDLRINMKWIAFAAVLGFGTKTILLQGRLTTALENTYIYSEKVEETLKNCEDLKAAAKSHDADLIIINDFFHLISNYSCSCAVKNFPATLYPTFERRTWALREEHAKIHRNVIVIDEEHHYADSTWLENIEGNPRWFLIKNNSLPTSKLMKRLGIVPRAY